ncbi:alpha/beta hydrolase family protein [Actinophytocola oryzae]|uniref:Chlorophyllase-like protein n=1 Tax=Actinophytocola oryzae TaxID=502181 RepID=A0A4V3FR95_9PSEU|nr:lipase [Actinophytocola oryzae]TDV42691.1 chlorophyllase-like protein [Actinophytocola oryzae]
MTTTRRGFLALTSTAALLLTASPARASTRARFTLPRPSGPHPVGVRQRHLAQRGRPDPWHPEADRELMISIWYPAHDCDRPHARYLDPLVARKYTTDGVLGVPPDTVDWATPTVTARRQAPPDGRHPVVVYAPGSGNSRALGTVLVEDLASHGYVVVTVDHTYETPIEFPGGRLVDVGIPADPPDLEAAKRLYMDAREADVHFVLDQLVDEPNADLDRLGLFGHSAGGVIATRVMRADPRVRAMANLDGFFEFGDNHPERGVDRPLLLMGAASHPEQPPLFGAVRTHLSDPGWATLWNASTGRRTDLSVREGRHYTYTDAQWFIPQLDVDPTGLIGTVGPRVVHGQRDILRYLFDRHLKGRPGRLPTHPDVTEVR